MSKLKDYNRNYYNPTLIGLLMNMKFIYKMLEATLRGIRYGFD